MYGIVQAAVFQRQKFVSGFMQAGMEGCDAKDCNHRGNGGISGYSAAKGKSRVWDAGHYGSLPSSALIVSGKNTGSG